MCTKTKRHVFRPGRLALMALLLWLALPVMTQAQDRAAEAYQKAYELVLDENWSQANDALQDFMDQFSRSNWADDAQFWWCYVQEKTGRFDEDAFDCYQDFVEDYSRSKYADDARSNMVRLAQRLARSGKREYLAVIESMQQEGDEEVKLAALDALWQMGDERALEAILDLYDSSGSEPFRKKIVFALSQFDDPKAAEKLKDIALQDPNPNIRKEAIFWISQRGDADVIPLLEEIAKADDSYEVQKQIIFAYSQLGRDGVPQLIRLARGHSDPDIQKEAIDRKSVV
ncbi:MAG: HEAT repeat domain-containing protein, partial [Rhodothermales bacterium]